MELQRRHFELIADVLATVRRELRPRPIGFDYSVSTEQDKVRAEGFEKTCAVWASLRFDEAADKVCLILKEENPAFNREKFLSRVSAD